MDLKVSCPIIFESSVKKMLNAIRFCHQIYEYSHEFTIYFKAQFLTTSLTSNMIPSFFLL